PIVRGAGEAVPHILVSLVCSYPPARLLRGGSQRPDAGTFPTPSGAPVPVRPASGRRTLSIISPDGARSFSGGTLATVASPKARWRTADHLHRCAKRRRAVPARTARR